MGLEIVTKVGRKPEVHVHVALTLVQSKFNDQKVEWKDQEHEVKQLAARWGGHAFGEITREAFDKAFQELKHGIEVEMRRCGAFKSGV